MSKIAEEKALEAYPKALSPYYGDDILDRNINCRAGYVKGYDTAMQDFLEKACEWLEDTQLENFICRDDGVYFDNEKLIEQFKNYMQNE
jgi:hypothetical protein